MNKSLAIKYLLSYESLFPQINSFLDSWNDIFGGIEAIDCLLKVDDLLLCLIEETLGLSKGFLWEYFSDKAEGKDFKIEVLGKEISIENISHLLNILGISS